eukprot:TRINITY_DN15824_c0_g1_i1.p1 TRINITY_DN15824_c0_g1~~TRINITY_DN15824_c0_g1_i1.p1  ORF type:complete len:207 (-),score=53.17 TRINITY_DN15824_c0_g1_i1:178-798(-)
MASLEEAFKILAARNEQHDHEHETARTEAQEASAGAQSKVQLTGEVPRVDVSGFSVCKLLQRFLSLQQERVGIYKEFHECFETYLQDRNLEYYQNVSAIVTNGFAHCSQEIRDVMAVLENTHKRLDLALILQQIQNLEKNKLTLTATYQVQVEHDYQQLGSAGSADDDQSMSPAARHIQDQIDVVIEHIREALQDVREYLADETEQ